MDIRQLTPDAAVAPQLEPTDMERLAALGFVTVIDNRPDTEIPPPLQAAEMRRAAESAGLNFVEVPVDTRTMSLETVERHANAMRTSDGPVLAYCASGTRSSILWAMSVAGSMPTDDIIGAAARAGYQLEMYRNQIDALARQRVDRA